MQKVTLEPDTNLQKINEVKMSMLKESLRQNEREKYADSGIRINVQNPETLNVAHFEGFKEDISESIKKSAIKIEEFT